MCMIVCSYDRMLVESDRLNTCVHTHGVSHEARHRYNDIQTLNGRDGLVFVSETLSRKVPYGRLFFPFLSEW